MANKDITVHFKVTFYVPYIRETKVILTDKQMYSIRSPAPCELALKL